MEDELQDDNTVDSSATGDQDVELTPEEAKRIQEENRRLKQSLRDQSKKHRTSLSGDEMASIMDQPKTDPTELAELKSRLERIEQAKKDEIARSEQSNLKWLYNQPWAKSLLPENDTDNATFQRFKRSFNKVMEDQVDSSPASTREAMRKAMVLVTGDPAPLTQRDASDQKKDDFERSMAMTPGNSEGGSSQGGQPMTPQEQAFVNFGQQVQQRLKTQAERDRARIK